MLVAALSWGSLSAQTLEKVFQNYLEVKNSLVDGNSSAASANASLLVSSVEELAQKGTESKGQKSILPEITSLAKAISTSNQLEQQRAGFGKLSESIWSLIKEDDSFTLPAYYTYCPMKKTHWISEFANIKNPFYGKQMLSCGKVESTINQ